MNKHTCTDCTCTDVTPPRHRFFSTHCNKHLHNILAVVLTASLIQDYYLGWHDWVTRFALGMMGTLLICKGMMWIIKLMSQSLSLDVLKP